MRPPWSIPHGGRHVVELRRRGLGLLLQRCDGVATCGIESYAEGTGPDGSPTVGINLRCLEGVDVDKLSPRAWDGRSK